MPDTPSHTARLGAIAFLLRPTYIATEFVTAAATTGGYSFVSDSVSKLGEVGCSTVLVPLDQDVALHAIAARSIGQPLALLLLGHRLREESPGLAKALLATGVVTATAAVGFILSGDERAAGALERLALWPVLFGLAGFAWGHRPGMGRPRH